MCITFFLGNPPKTNQKQQASKFANSNKHLNEVEQTQFIELLDKVLKSAPKREQNKIFKGSDNLKEALYLHNDDARRQKLKG